MVAATNKSQRRLSARVQLGQRTPTSAKASEAPDRSVSRRIHANLTQKMSKKNVEAKRGAKVEKPIKFENRIKPEPHVHVLTLPRCLLQTALVQSHVNKPRDWRSWRRLKTRRAHDSAKGLPRLPMTMPEVAVMGAVSKTAGYRTDVWVRDYRL